MWLINFYGTWSYHSLCNMYVCMNGSNNFILRNQSNNVLGIEEFLCWRGMDFFAFLKTFLRKRKFGGPHVELIRVCLYSIYINLRLPPFKFVILFLPDKRTDPWKRDISEICYMLYKPNMRILVHSLKVMGIFIDRFFFLYCFLWRLAWKCGAP